MNLDLEIRENLGLYLSGAKTLDQFKEWFVPATWSLVGRDADLSGEIRLVMAEHSGRHIDEGQLQAALKAFVSDYLVQAFEPDGIVPGTNPADKVVNIVSSITSGQGSVAQA